MMTDPFARFRAECEALVKSRVREPAGYVFERPPKKEFGQLACNVAFQLTRVRKNDPLPIARAIVAGMDRASFRLVRDVRAAAPGFINFYVDEPAYARLVLDAVQADGALYGRGEPGPDGRMLVEHPPITAGLPWSVAYARAALVGDTLARLYRFAGDSVEVHGRVDDTSDEAARVIVGLRRVGYLSDDGALQLPAGRKLDHVCAEALGQLHEGLAERGEPVAAETADWREEADAIAADVEATRRALLAGAYRDVVRACVDAQTLTAWRLGVFYDLMICDGDVARAGLVEDALAHAAGSRFVHRSADGRLVVDARRALSRRAASVNHAHEQELALIADDGRPTGAGVDLAYRRWALGLPDNRLRYASDAVQPNGQALWISSHAGAERDRFAATDIIAVVEERRAEAARVVAALTRSPDLARVSVVTCGPVSRPADGVEIALDGPEAADMPGMAVDDLLDRATAEALERLLAEHDAALDDEGMRDAALRLAVAGLRYALMRHNAHGMIAPDPADVVAAGGAGVAYLLDSRARVGAVLQQAAERGVARIAWNPDDADGLTDPVESDLIDALGRWPDVVRSTQETLAVYLLAEYAHELAARCNEFVARCPILDVRPPLPPGRLRARLALATAASTVMGSLYGILGLGDSQSPTGTAGFQPAGGYP